MSNLGFKNRVDVEGKPNAILMWIESDTPSTRQGIAITSRHRANQIAQALLGAVRSLWGFEFDDVDEDELVLDPEEGDSA